MLIVKFALIVNVGIFRKNELKTMKLIMVLICRKSNWVPEVDETSEKR